MPVQSTSAASRRPRHRRRKEARPGEIAAAALALFVEHGYAATRLEDVARRAGVTKGTVYLYFESKEALFDGVIRQAIVPALERGEQQIATHDGSASELLRAILADWASLLSEGPLSRVPKLMVTDADKFPALAEMFHDAVLERGALLLEKVIRLGVERGEFRDIDADAVVEVLLSALWMPIIARDSAGFRRGASGYSSAYLGTLIDLSLSGLLWMDPQRRP